MKKQKTFRATVTGGPTNPNPIQTRVDWAQYATFTEGDQLGVFGPTRFPPPKREMSYNDDVVLPLYESSMRSYAGTHRNCIRGEHPDASNVHEHVISALLAPFFLAQSTPIPPITGRALDFLALSCPVAVSAFWKKQIGHLERLAEEQKGVSSSWDACRPTSLRPIEPVNVLLQDFLMRRFKIGGGNGSGS